MSSSITKRGLLASSLAMGSIRASAQGTAPTIRLGILNDQSSTYRDNGGPGSVACVRLAVSELAAKLGLNVEIISADHQNKPDVAAGIARQWLDQGVDALCDIQGSAIALAVNNIVRERDKVMLGFNIGSAEVTGKSCTPNIVHFAYDSYMLARVAGTTLVRDGGDTWFFIRADYTFGRALQDDATVFINRAGGRVIGSVALPFPTTDFASALVQAQGSRAKVIGLANAGDDLVNAVKQAGEFGVTRRGTRLAAMLIFINNVHAIGLRAAQGLVLTETFYWDMNDKTRAFTRRVFDAGFSRNLRPNMSQAACYAGTLHYLKAVASLGAAEAKRSGAAVVARMKQMPMEDDIYGQAAIREDGRAVSPAYLFEVKKPEESKGDWDYYKLLQTVPAEQAWRPLSEGGCSLVRS
ncbi:ABC transporter substrate-binding protein [Pararoseomonas indoligenes]|uniref:ABC transporter substrate-binding protein n=1 Tax=Roseomonas indoligenes TaxID=2820811 RepID=A0A940S8K1_9PROT|nr:ABC transporter substrate-binding protein [Pararoseomonas indoligenes]MBP0496184.1 ABC transporter substrate-binding protein [Pararoseomonas indoligenes]